jgi:hypothetical protein
MTRLTSSVGAVMVLVAGTSLLLLPSPEARPRRGGQHKEAAVQEDLLPYAKVVSPAVLKRDYAIMRVTPFNDRKFYFELTVPRSFQNNPLQVSPQQRREDASTPVPMAEFKPKGDDSVLIEARYVRVPEGVTLDRFMAAFVEQSGFEFVKRQRGDFDGRQVEDALLRVNSPVFGKTLTRVTASRRGDLVFMVAASCKAGDYPKWKQAFAVAALSFSPTGK